MGSVTILKYRLDLTTKYQKPVLQGIEQSVFKSLRRVEEVSDFRILDMQIEDRNRVRLAIKMSPIYIVYRRWLTVLRDYHSIICGKKKRIIYDSFTGEQGRNCGKGLTSVQLLVAYRKKMVLSRIEKQNGPREEL